MMRKIILGLTILVVIFTGCKSKSYDFSAVCESGQTLYYNVTSNIDNTVEVIGGDNLTGNLVIPESINHNGAIYSVSEIGDYAFDNCADLTSVVIPNSIINIGNGAFDECIGLMYLTIPNSVTHIGYDAFSGCIGLTEINYNATNCQMETDCLNDLAFAGCNANAKINIGDSVSVIPDHAFYGIIGIDSLIIPSSVKRIGCSAFCSCSGLSSVIIGDSVSEIGVGAFSGCSGITSVFIPKTVASIGRDAFSDVVNVEYYGSDTTNCPWGARNLNGFVEGYLVYSDETRTQLIGCSSIPTEVTIPNSVTCIGNGNFLGWRNLETITIPSSVTIINYNAFYGWWSGGEKTEKLNSVFYTGDIEQWCKITIYSQPLIYAHNLYIDNSLVTDLVMPNTITEIKQNAFGGATCLTSISIPSSITRIGHKAFYGCSELESIIVEPGNAYYDSRNNCNAIIETETNTLITGCKNTIIPNSVTKINANAFYRCRGMATITIPSSVTSIGDEAFYGCRGLTSTIIGNSVTSIGDYAFGNCRSLTSVTIPNSVTNIGEGAFYNCDSLTVVSLGDSIEKIGKEAFRGCICLKTIKIPDLVSEIADGAFQHCEALSSITIGEYVSYIGSDAFDGCENLNTITFNATKCDIYHDKYSLYGNNKNSWLGAYNNIHTINIGRNVEEIPSGAFNGCDKLIRINYNAIDCRSGGLSHCHNLKIVNIGDDVTNIPPYAFSNNSELKYVLFSNNCSLQSIGWNAFEGCSNLFLIKIPNSVTSIGESAFYETGWYNYQKSGVLYLDGWCLGYKDYQPNGSLEIKGGTKGFQNGAFKNCCGLTSITMPKSIKYIGDNTFKDCCGLESVTHIDKSDNHCYDIYGKIILPNSVVSIGRMAFYGCSRLRYANITDSVTHIGAYAFKGCSIKEPIYNANCFAYFPCGYAIEYAIPEGIRQISGGAFEGCHGLVSVSIPNSVTNIDYDAFYHVKNIVYSGSATGSPWRALTVNGTFDGNFIYSDAERTNLTAYIGDGGSVVIPNYVTSIGCEAFSGCSALTSVTIPNSVTSIDEGAFWGCDGLTSVTIGNSVTSIGRMAFYGCLALTSVTIPNSVTSIGDLAFGNCDGMTSVTIPKSITNIGYGAFRDCKSLPKATVEMIRNINWNGYFDSDEMYNNNKNDIEINAEQ